MTNHRHGRIQNEKDLFEDVWDELVNERLVKCNVCFREFCNDTVYKVVVVSREIYGSDSRRVVTIRHFSTVLFCL